MQNFISEQRFTIGAVALVILAVVFMSGAFSRSETGASLADSRGSSPKAASVREFTTTIKNFASSPKNIDVNLGDSVIVDITNRDQVTHGISLPVFGVNTSVAPGATRRITFVADKTGNPETFCSTDHGEKLLINVTK